MSNVLAGLREASYPILSTIILWVAFGQLQQLKTAGEKGGCCSGTQEQNNTCGKSKAGRLVWYSVLITAILGTVWSLMVVNNKSGFITGVGHPSRYVPFMKDATRSGPRLPDGTGAFGM
jgi:hypothetical protein